MRVRKRPIEVEAVQWQDTQESLAEIEKLGEGTSQIHYSDYSNLLFVHYFTGPIGSEQVEVDDWIIKGVDGKIHLCRSDIFGKTYDVVEGGAYPVVTAFFIPYHLDCDIDIPESFPTLEEAVDCAGDMLICLDGIAPFYGWHEDMDNFKIVDAAGRRYYRFRRVNKINRPDDIDEKTYSKSTDCFWPLEQDYLCDYELCEAIEK